MYRSNDELPCDGIIKYNRVYENLGDGIVLSGPNTFADIFHNVPIRYNGGAGIRITNKAHACIKHNLIGFNSKQVLACLGNTHH